MRVLGYVRVSTEEQANSRAGLDAQRAAIVAEAERRGWTLLDVIEDAGFSAKDLRRPGIRIALEELKSGRADALVIAKLDRLSRSMLDFAGLMATAQRQRWGIVALDVNVDTTTPSGEMMANVTAAFAQFERRLISQRTREALAQRKAAGVRLGRERIIPAVVEARAHALKAEGLSVRQIAAALTVEGHKPPSGGAWQPSTLQRILTRSVAA
jgi:DNA invertase Pin-like site-specific DNA recombinase